MPLGILDSMQCVHQGATIVYVYPFKGDPACEAVPDVGGVRSVSQKKKIGPSKFLAVFRHRHHGELK